MWTKSPDSPGMNWDSQEVAERRSRGRARRAEIQGPATQMMLDLAEVRSWRPGARRGGRHGRSNSHGGTSALDRPATCWPQTFPPACLSWRPIRRERRVLTNVETRVIDAENIDLDADSFDAVICQLGLFLFSNPAERAWRNAPSGSARGKSCGTGVLYSGKKSVPRHHFGRRTPLWETAPLPLFFPRRNRCAREYLQRKRLARCHHPSIQLFAPSFLIHRGDDPKAEGNRFSSRTDRKIGRSRT